MTATSQLQPSHQELASRILRWVPRVGVLAWAGFWGWFVLMVGSSDIHQGLKGTGWVMAAWFASLIALVAGVWIKPRVGGLMMLAAAMVCVYLFRGPDQTHLILTLPAVLIGLSSLASPRMR